MLKLPFGQKYLVVGCFCFHIVILWGDVDVYVYNVGPGNFVRVLFDVQQSEEEEEEEKEEEEEGQRKTKKELIVDCGSISGKSIIEDKVENFSNADIRESMLWITHLHIDHYNGFCGSQSPILKSFYDRIGKIIIGGAITQATRCLESNQWWEKKNKETDIRTLKVWNYKEQEVRAIKDALNNFKERCKGNLKFFVLIPQHNYKLQPSDNENAQSLVLGIEYNGVKMLFPGDAPGKMFSALPREDQQFVQNVNILVAPHHGSFEAENERWYYYTRKRANNQLFCVIASCDPGCGSWKLPKKRFCTEGKGYMFDLCQNKHGVRYYNDWINKCCTYKTRQSKFVTCMASVGYHVKVGNGQEKALEDRIKIFEVLGNKAGDLIEKPVEMKDERKSIVCNIGRFVRNVGRFVCKCFSNAEGEEEEETSLGESESDSSTRSAETGTQPQLPPGGSSSAGSSESSARSAETGIQPQLPLGVGLANLGASCYINASAQLLYSIPDIRREVLDMTTENNQLQGLQRIFRLMQNPPSNRTIETNSLEEPCEQLGYIADRQEDVVEFITGLLDAMEGVQRGSTACLRYDIQVTILYRNGNRKKGETIKNESFIFFPLAINTTSKTLLRVLKEECNTEERLRRYEYAEKCYADNAQRIQTITRIPDYMLFQISRFGSGPWYTEKDADGVERRKRNGTKLLNSFEFPFELNLQMFCTKNIVSSKLELCGVIVHSGATPNNGHYFVFLKDEDNHWWKYNDGNITKVNFTPGNVRMNKEDAEAFFKSEGGLADKQNPYILLYKKTQ